jgi:hypothetical protein
VELINWVWLNVLFPNHISHKNFSAHWGTLPDPNTIFRAVNGDFLILPLLLYLLVDLFWKRPFNLALLTITRVSVPTHRCLCQCVYRNVFHEYFDGCVVQLMASGSPFKLSFQHSSVVLQHSFALCHFVLFLCHSWSQPFLKSALALFIYFLKLLLHWGCIVIFIRILITYHNLIHPLHHSLSSSLPPFME